MHIDSKTSYPYHIPVLMFPYYIIKQISYHFTAWCSPNRIHAVYEEICFSLRKNPALNAHGI